MENILKILTTFLVIFMYRIIIKDIIKYYAKQNKYLYIFIGIAGNIYMLYSCIKMWLI